MSPRKRCRAPRRERIVRRARTSWVPRRKTRPRKRSHTSTRWRRGACLGWSWSARSRVSSSNSNKNWGPMCRAWRGANRLRIRRDRRMRSTSMKRWPRSAGGTSRTRGTSVCPARAARARPVYRRRCRARTNNRAWNYARAPPRSERNGRAATATTRRIRARGTGALRLRAEGPVSAARILPQLISPGKRDVSWTVHKRRLSEKFAYTQSRICYFRSTTTASNGTSSTSLSNMRRLKARDMSNTSLVTSDGTLTPDIIQDITVVPFCDDGETSSVYSCDTEGYYTSFHMDSGLKTLREEEPVPQNPLSKSNDIGSDPTSPVVENEYELFGRGSTSTTTSSAGTVCTALMAPPPPERKSSLTVVAMVSF